MTRMPAVQERVKKLFGREGHKASIRTKWCYRAAIQAGVLKAIEGCSPP